MGPHIFSLISIRKSVKFLQAELISFRFGHSDVPATCHRICRAGSIFLFVCLPEPWNYLMIFNIFLLIVSLIWYEVPGAKKLAAKSTKLKVKDLDILAKRMGVNAEIYVMDLQNLGAFQIGAKGKYVFLTKKLVKTLKKEELMSMVAHEFAHIKLRHVLKKVLMFDVIIGTGVNMTIIVPIMNFSLDVNATSALFLWGAILLYILLRRVIWQYFEYRADCYAIEFVDKEHLISALMKINSILYSPNLIEKGKVHPIIKRRVAKIKNCGGYG